MRGLRGACPANFGYSKRRITAAARAALAVEEDEEDEEWSLYGEGQDEENGGIEDGDEGGQHREVENQGERAGDDAHGDHDYNDEDADDEDIAEMERAAAAAADLRILCRIRGPLLARLAEEEDDNAHRVAARDRLRHHLHEAVDALFDCLRS